MKKLFTAGVAALGLVLTGCAGEQADTAPPVTATTAVEAIAETTQATTTEVTTGTPPPATTTVEAIAETPAPKGAPTPDHAAAHYMLFEEPIQATKIYWDQGRNLYHLCITDPGITGYGFVNKTGTGCSVGMSYYDLRAAVEGAWNDAGDKAVAEIEAHNQQHGYTAPVPAYEHAPVETWDPAVDAPHSGPAVDADYCAALYC